MPTYRYEVLGSATQDQTWVVTGFSKTENQGDFALVPDMALRDAFFQLTQGKAVYGKPGIGCSGPYRIHRLIIEEVPHGKAN
jgi:hypothetical protein